MQRVRINIKEVGEQFGYSYPQIHRLSHKKTNPFPAGIRIGREITWRVEQITQWEQLEEELKQEERAERNARRAAAKASVDAAAAEVAPEVAPEPDPQDELKRKLMTPNRIRGKRS